MIGYLIKGELLDGAYWDPEIPCGRIAVLNYNVWAKSPSWEKLPEIEKLSIYFDSFVD